MIPLNKTTFFQFNSYFQKEKLLLCLQLSLIKDGVDALFRYTETLHGSVELNCFTEQLRFCTSLFCYCRNLQGLCSSEFLYVDLGASPLWTTAAVLSPTCFITNTLHLALHYRAGESRVGWGWLSQEKTRRLL